MCFEDNTIRIDYKTYLESISDKVMFVYSCRSIEINNIELNKNYINCSTKYLTQDTVTIKERINNFSNFDIVVGFGGGTAIDIAKYIGSVFNKKVVVIPTMISTNAYATDKVALYKDEKKCTILSKNPDVIILDKDILKRSSQKNIYGLADVLSIYTALNDWDLSVKYNNEKKADQYNEAQDLLLKTSNFINNNSYENICNNIDMIYELVGVAGEITNSYGNGKPESGSEHIFAKSLEQNIKVPHAISVCNGILLMSLLQNKFSTDIYNAIIKLRIFDDEKVYGVNTNLLKNTFFSLKIREDRFSIINLNRDYDEVFKEFLKIKLEVLK